MNTGDVFVERFRRLRRDKGWRQQDLAEKVGTTQQRIALFEQGRATPSLELLAAMAIAFETTADYLLGLSNEREKSPLPFAELDESETEALRLLQVQSADNKKRLVAVLRLAAH